MTAKPPLTMDVPDANRTNGCSSPSFTDTNVQPLKDAGNAAPSENAANSIHSSAVLKSDPIHITSLITMLTLTSAQASCANAVDDGNN